MLDAKVLQLDLKEIEDKDSTMKSDLNKHRKLSGSYFQDMITSMREILGIASKIFHKKNEPCSQCILPANLVL